MIEPFKYYYSESLYEIKLTHNPRSSIVSILHLKVSNPRNILNIDYKYYIIFKFIQRHSKPK